MLQWLLPRRLNPLMKFWSVLCQWVSALSVFYFEIGFKLVWAFHYSKLLCTAQRMSELVRLLEDGELVIHSLQSVMWQWRIATFGWWFNGWVQPIDHLLWYAIWSIPFSMIKLHTWSLHLAQMHKVFSFSLSSEK